PLHIVLLSSCCVAATPRSKPPRLLRLRRRAHARSLARSSLVVDDARPAPHRPSALVVRDEVLGEAPRRRPFSLPRERGFARGGVILGAGAVEVPQSLRDGAVKCAPRSLRPAGRRAVVRVTLVADEVSGSSVGVAHKREAPTRRTKLLFAPRACDGSDTRLCALLADGRVAAPGNHRRFHPLGLDARHVEVGGELVAAPGALGGGTAHDLRDGGRGGHGL
ncbi:unnamed protein product, partial [Pelagomonas calceolata]